MLPTDWDLSFMKTSKPASQLLAKRCFGNFDPWEFGSCVNVFLNLNIVEIYMFYIYLSLCITHRDDAWELRRSRKQTRQVWCLIMTSGIPLPGNQQDHKWWFGVRSGLWDIPHCGFGHILQIGILVKIFGYAR